MKIVSRSFSQGEAGSVKILPDEADDLWHVYNLIGQGDTVTAVTVRKVHKETSTGANDSERVRLKLGVVVENVEYDNVAAVLRVRGKNISENEHVKLGAYHTLEIDLKRPLTISKESWDSLAIETLTQACDPRSTAELAALMMQEGLANVCLVGPSITTVKARIEAQIPRKRGPAIAGYDKAMQTFFKNVLQAVLMHVDLNVIRCLVIASPGFVKDQFYEYMLLEASRGDLRAIIENKSKIVLNHVSSGYKHALKELLSCPSVMARIKDTKAAKEVKALEDFFKMMASDPSRAFYGPKHVEAAHEQAAVQTLLISDELFRNADVNVRRKYVNLVESVKELGGAAYIFSSRHISGEQLGQLTGIAAILRFPLPELEDLEM